MIENFFIGNTEVGYNLPPYYIADIGANHDGSLEKAFKLIELVKESGGHAAKFQNFQASKIVSKFGFESLKQISSHQSKWKKSVFEVYEDTSINLEWTNKLKEKCVSVGVEYFSSPYDKESVDFIDAFVELYKIGSGDITWTEIIEYIASKNKPVLLAAGASNLDDVKRAMDILLVKNIPVCLMQCNTNYTTDIDKIKYVNLNVLDTFSKLYPKTLLGLSDHTPGFTSVLGAIAKGARIIEKHFTDNNDLTGPDHKFAMNPSSWKEMVKYGDEMYYALGDGIKKVEENEKEAIIVQQRCLRASLNLPKGHIISKEDIVSLRPKPIGSIEPYKIDQIIGKKLKSDLVEGDYFSLKNID